MKKTFNYFAKQLLLVVFLISPALLSAQYTPMKYPGNKTEKKAEKHSFIIYEQGDSYFLFNKSNSLMIFESSYDKRTEQSQVPYDTYVKFYDKLKIDDLVYKIIAPHFKEYKSKYSDMVSSFDIVLYSKPDGKICEFAFSYNKNAKIPMKAIEKLEREILALDLHFTFDELAYEPLIKEALWVFYPLSYSVARMKKNLTEENK